jgi:hypothetical protein
MFWTTQFVARPYSKFGHDIKIFLQFLSLATPSGSEIKGQFSGLLLTGNCLRMFSNISIMRGKTYCQFGLP